MLALTVNALGWALVHFLWQGILIGCGYALCRHLLRSKPPVWRYLAGLAALALTVAVPLWTFLGLMEIEATSVPAALASVGGWQLWAASALPLIVIAWGIGVCAVSVRVIWGWCQLNRLRNEGTWNLPEGWDARVDRLQRAFGVTQKVLVRVSDQVIVPTVMGWLRPIILIPTSVVTGLSTQQLELIIAHELGHIRRLDYLVNLVQVMVETLLFYHPAVHWISRRVREDRELCCDDLVLATCGQPVDYAKALTNLETLRSGWLQPVLNASGGSLLERVERILFRRDEDNNRPSIGAQAAVAALTFCVVLVSAVRHGPAVAIETIAVRIELPAATASMVTEPSQLAINPVSMLAAATRSQILKPDPLPILEHALSQLARSAEAIVGISSRSQSDSEALTIRQHSQGAGSGLQRLVVNQHAIERKLPTPAESPFRVDNTPMLAGVRLTPAPMGTLPNAAFAPVAKHRVAPEYPARALLRGDEGTVTVAFAIDKDGSVVDVEVIKSGERLFNAAAVEAIRQWQFDPTSHGSAKRVTQTFTFSLNGESLGDRTEDRCRMVTGSRICHPGAERLAYYQRS